MRTYRKFSIEFKRKLVEELKSGVITMAQACRQHELSSALIYRWSDQYEHGKLNNEPSEIGALENKIAELERKVGQQAMEIDLLKKLREQRLKNARERSSAPVLKVVSGNDVV
jgi:putative transposase